MTGLHDDDEPAIKKKTIRSINPQIKIKYMFAHP
jgi:hypothetical protein